MTEQVKSDIKFEMPKALAVLCLGVVGVLAWVYYPTFVWMIGRWSAKDSYYGHGFLIPAISLYWIWTHREAFREQSSRVSIAGVTMLVFGLLIQVVSAVLRIYFLSAFSFVIVLAGLFLTLFGWASFKRILFPLFFLFLMIPLPLLVISEVTLKLKFFISELATYCLNGVGLTAHREGSYIVLPNAYLLVGDPCSGLRSFLSFLCLGFVFAYGKSLNWIGKILIIAAGLPLAIASNLLRVFGLGLIAEIYGQDAAGGFAHDASGIIVFIIAFIFFMIFRQMLEEKLHA